MTKCHFSIGKQPLSYDQSGTLLLNSINAEML